MAGGGIPGRPLAMGERFNLQIHYYRKDNPGDAVFSVFIAALFRPGRLFVDMPRATGFRDSTRLMAMYMSLPLLMASMLTGIISAVVIVPVGLAVGLGTSWLWAVWLAWAARTFTCTPLSTADTFQICAYSTPPLAIAWGPYLGPLMALWNLFLNWRGLVVHGGMGRISALGIIIAGIVGLAAIITVLAGLLYLLAPASMALLMDTVQQLQ
ncbi:MAG: hypothetical protein Q9M29_06160 [Mariprofundaceae bacterium]|nr:hypothetical protein [Mariprofundaceae bacterium]